MSNEYIKDGVTKQEFKFEKGDSVVVTSEAVTLFDKGKFPKNWINVVDEEGTTYFTVLSPSQNKLLSNYKVIKGLKLTTRLYDASYTDKNGLEKIRKDCVAIDINKGDTQPAPQQKPQEGSVPELVKEVLKQRPLQPHEQEIISVAEDNPSDFIKKFGKPYTLKGACLPMDFFVWLRTEGNDAQKVMTYEEMLHVYNVIINKFEKG